MRLTEDAVKALAYDPKGKDTQLVWDSEIPGMAVRLYPSGKRTYVVAYRVGRGRAAPTRRVVIDDTRRITLREARDKARKIIGEGRDGKDFLQQVRAVEDSMLRVEVAYGRFYNEYVVPRLKPNSQRLIRSAFTAHILPFCGRKLVRDVQRADVAKLVSNLGMRAPRMANHVLAVFGQFFSWAEEHGLRVEGSNPTRKVTRFKIAQRRVMLTKEQFHALWAVVSKQAPAYAAAYKLLLYTSGRVGEGLDLRWTPDPQGIAPHVDLENRMIVLPQAKTGAREIPLNRGALLVLEQLPRTGVRVLPVRYKLEARWREIRGEAGLPKLQLRDFRHLAITLAGRSGKGGPLGPRDMAGHTDLSMTQGYWETTSAEARAASEGIVDELERMGIRERPVEAGVM